MKIGVIGLGRMGANIVRRLMRAGHSCVVFDANAAAGQALAGEGAVAAASLADLVKALGESPRTVWVMLPSGKITEDTVGQLAGLLKSGDTIIDGGNSNFKDDVRRGRELRPKGIHYMDVGTSGGVWGLQRGYSLMIGGDKEAVQRLDPIFRALAPGVEAAPRTPGREKAGGTAEYGYLHCGPNGAGHFVKMVHNGIEYGMMAALAEGLNILRHANVGLGKHEVDAETTPLRNPEFYQFEFNLADVAEVWRRGSVIQSWLLDLIATALLESPEL